MKPLKSLSMKRMHTNVQDPGKTSARFSRGSPFKPNRPRINTIQNEEELKLIRTKSNCSPAKLPSCSDPCLWPSKFYQSRLVLSSESWSAYNLKEQKYKRGWKPIRNVNFTGFLRFLFLKVYFILERGFPAIQKVQARANRYLLKQQIVNRTKSLSLQLKLKTQKQKKEDPYLLAQNTIIELKGLVFGHLFSNYEDLGEYAAIFLGAVLKDIREGEKFEGKTYQFEEPTDKEDTLQKDSYIRQLVRYINTWLHSNTFTSSKLSKTLQFFTTPQQFSRIFSNLLTLDPQFQSLLSSRFFITTIKYQMGYKFYEQRKIKFVNEWPSMTDHLIVKCKNGGYFGVVSYNMKTFNVVVLNECKYSMEDCDIAKIQEFLKGLAKPIVQKKESPVKLPVLRLSQ